MDFLTRDAWIGENTLLADDKLKNGSTWVQVVNRAQTKGYLQESGDPQTAASLHMSHNIRGDVFMEAAS